jgi:hypothetical protein
MNGVEMSVGIPERRRSQRTALTTASWLTAPTAWPVKLVDLSLGGLAFSSPYGLEVGRTVAVRATLGRDAFSGQIRVCWSRPRGGAGALRPEFEVGAVFLPLDESSRRALESFLKLSPPE